MADKDPCDLIKGPGRAYCEADNSGGGPPDTNGVGGTGGGLTHGASDHVRQLAESLIKQINSLIAPKDTWAPAKADNWVYEQFLWLGQHLAVTVFICVVVVCGLTAWQGAPRLKQMGASTGWTLAAVAGMASVPGTVMLLNKAVSNAFTAAFDSNETTLFPAINSDLKHSGNPLALLLIISALVVALAFAALVFMTRQLGILVFVCMAPLVLASLARGGDMTAVKTWAMRLLGLMFAPFALLLISPFVKLAEGSLVMDTVLLVAADALMLRMIFHGVPYFGPKVARTARTMVERNTTNPIARAVVRAGAPDFYEQENTPRLPRTMPTPGRAMSQDRGVLFAAYGVKQPQRPGRLTTESAVASARRQATEAATRNEQIRQVRQQARAAAQPQTGGTQPPNRRGQGVNPRPAPGRTGQPGGSGSTP
ncbi:hypothetical protein ACF09I_32480 [Streptomyces sp. NPDC014940]|uniref:hypothetical protein n=1 Tax=Streptomyces sp. NPDC014940 TaxID=3364932 RepID=UPI0036FC4D1E